MRLSWAAALVLSFAAMSSQHPEADSQKPSVERLSFDTSDNCLACHNGLTTPSGKDVSIGTSWRASMMAHSSRDPYWQASVRRETLDHPESAAAIEDECAVCHMPMATAMARDANRLGQVFRLSPTSGTLDQEHRLAADGVSCTLCHQIGSEHLGERESFSGGFSIRRERGNRIFGPYDVTHGLSTVMHSSSGRQPEHADYYRSSDLCATCHTLYTKALGPDGRTTGTLPEQVPFLEWKHSAVAAEKTCQGCHMPSEAGIPVASVLGEAREQLSRHTFFGGNAFMLRMLNKYRHELGVVAPSNELSAGAEATERQLQRDTATIAIGTPELVAGGLWFDVSVKNLTGHKLPTGYPSRRVWLHVVVKDASNRVVFESGGLSSSGEIQGNDNDADARRVEPHYPEIHSPDEVQVYESVLADASGRVTTGLLQATAYIKDNRLLPRGFDKATADNDIAVHGDAVDDPDFSGEGDRVKYHVPLSGASLPLQVDVELRFQTIGFRWASTLKGYDAVEPRRFVSAYDAMADFSSTVLAHATASMK